MPTQAEVLPPGGHDGAADAMGRRRKRYLVLGLWALAGGLLIFLLLVVPPLAGAGGGCGGG